MLGPVRITICAPSGSRFRSFGTNWPAGALMLPHEVVGKRLRVGVADLDVVTEDPVEANLERADACAPALRVFELCDPLAGALRGVRDRVEVSVEAGRDNSVTAAGRRILDQGAGKQRRELRS